MSQRILVATRKGLFMLDRTAAGWAITSDAFLGDNCSIIMHDPRDGALYVALDHGHFGAKMQRSRDHGKTWEEVATPAYPEKPDDYPEHHRPEQGEALAWNLRLIWALTPGSTDQPGRIWAGTGPGGLFRSDDHGQSWTLIRSLWDLPERQRWFGGGYDYPAIHSICVDPRNADLVRVAVSCGGVWTTTDSGESWACRSTGMRAEYMPPDNQFDPVVQDPHLIVQCAGEPDKLWTQHHNGIFRSVDGSESWQEIENVKPSAFGFAVCVHPHDGDIAWFVPAIKDELRIPVDGRVVVTRTRDGGNTFDVLTSGLPQQRAYDLTFRHAMDIDDSGDLLAFGTTTGSLFFTEDQGDTWQCLSHHLPPVHVVRFV